MTSGVIGGVERLTIPVGMSEFAVMDALFGSDTMNFGDPFACEKIQAIAKDNKFIFSWSSGEVVGVFSNRTLTLHNFGKPLVWWPQERINSYNQKRMGSCICKYDRERFVQIRSRL